MKSVQAALILREHNKWRKGDDKAKHQDPKKVGEAINKAIKVLAQVGWAID